MGRYLALDRGDRWLLIRAFFWLTLADIWLRLGGFRREARNGLLRADPASALAGADDVRRARLYARWLDIATRHHVVSMRCLHRSLALHYWLRSEGVRSDLWIGVRREGDRLNAHAWVELGGHLVNDVPVKVRAFTPLTPSRSLTRGTKTTGAVADLESREHERALQWY